jgi:hypothetical protein
MFERAARMKLRFGTSKGSASASPEDLWDIPLVGTGLSLNTIAKSLNQQLKAGAEEDFVQVKSSTDQQLTLKFNIVKHVIAVRLQESEASKNAVDDKAHNQMILGLIAEQEQASLNGKTAEELRALLR